MKHFIPLVSLLSIALICGECSAKPPEGERGKRDAGEPGQREFGQRGPRRQGGAIDRDPAQMVARMMKEFDTDGDEKLDVTELKKLFATMRDRRGVGRGAGPAQRRGTGMAQGQGRPGNKAGGRARRNRNRGQRGADEVGNPGGEKPKRPEAEES